MANQNQKQIKKKSIQQLPVVGMDIKENKVLEASKTLKKLILEITDENISNIKKEELLNELYMFVTPLLKEYLCGENPYFIRIFSTFPEQAGVFYYNINTYSSSSIREILSIYQNNNISNIKSEIPNFDLLLDKIEKYVPPKKNNNMSAYNIFTNIVNNIENMEADEDYLALAQAGL